MNRTEVLQNQLWVVVNTKTGRVSWTRTSKRPAVFNTRREARLALVNGETCAGKVVKFAETEKTV